MAPRKKKTTKKTAKKTSETKTEEAVEESASTNDVQESKTVPDTDVDSGSVADDSSSVDVVASEPSAVKSGPSKVIGNARTTGPVRVSGIQLAAKGEDGDQVELSIEQQQDQNLKRLLVRNVASGLLEWR